MSARIALLQDALSALFVATVNLPAASPASAAATRRAAEVLSATAFVAPGTFPAVVGTRSGAVVKLLALHEGRLIGAHVDSDGMQLQDWDAEGRMFGADDPDDFDLVLPEDAPVVVPEASNIVVHDFTRSAADVAAAVVTLPILGRIS